MARKLRRFFGMKTGRGLTLEAVALLAFFRIALHLVPFRRLATLMGRPMAESPATTSAPERDQARRVGGAIMRCASHLGWARNCLAQALAGQLMLRRRGVPSTVYFGVALEGETELSAHAWLRCGEQIVTGRAGMERYKVISCFAPASDSPEGLSDKLPAMEATASPDTHP